MLKPGAPRAWHHPVTESRRSPAWYDVLMSQGPAQPLAVDDRLIVPESRFEVVDGEVLYVSPADPPHASRHSKLSALLEAYSAEGFDAASDMLTRTSATGDMAPDGSVYPLGPDPETGGRRLEELAFEIASTQSLHTAGKKAAALSGRGVRRVFVIDVERERAFEWSAAEGTWVSLPADGEIEDSVLVIPLPVHDLVSAARADDAIARALLAKGNPVLLQALAAERAMGEAEGRAAVARAVLAILALRGLEVATTQRSRILSTRDPAVLDRWLTHAPTCRSIAELLDS
jgi:Uma2 family endonuclease